MRMGVVTVVVVHELTTVQTRVIVLIGTPSPISNLPEKTTPSSFLWLNHMVLIIVGITGVNSHPSQVVMSCGMALGSSLAFYNNTMYLIQIVILAEKLYNSTAIDFIVIDLTKTIRVWDDGMGNHLQLSPHFGSTITQLITRIRLVNNWRIAHTSFMISSLSWIWTLRDTQALSQTWAHMSRLLARSGKGSVVQTITRYSLIAASRILCVTLLKSLAQTCLRLLVVSYCGCEATTVDSGE